MGAIPSGLVVLRSICNLIATTRRIAPVTHAVVACWVRTRILSIRSQWAPRMPSRLRRCHLVILVGYPRVVRMTFVITRTQLSVSQRPMKSFETNMERSTSQWTSQITFRCKNLYLGRQKLPLGPILTSRSLQISNRSVSMATRTTLGSTPP